MEVTPEHPIYVEGRGWLNAENLSVGDRLRRADGGLAKVLAIERVSLDEPEVVYNFTVKGPHTYFVLEAGVLVHNDSGTCDILLPGGGRHAVSTPDPARPLDIVLPGGGVVRTSPFSDVPIDEQLFWIRKNIISGDVDEVLRRFGIDPTARWVKETGLKEDLLKIGTRFEDKPVAPYGALDIMDPKNWTQKRAKNVL